MKIHEYEEQRTGIPYVLGCVRSRTSGFLKQSDCQACPVVGKKSINIKNRLDDFQYIDRNGFFPTDKQ